MIEIYAIGGYNEIGKNMTVVRIDDEAIILDMGLNMESYISFTDSREDISEVPANVLIKNNIVPDFSKIKHLKGIIKAIIPTHAHLDHLGAVPHIAKNFDCPVIATPFTVEVLKSILADDNFDFTNEVKVLNINSKIKLTKEITIEFINATHSTPQTVMVAIHTKYGVIMYANDFKFDEFPTFGLKTNIEKLRKFGKNHDVIALIVDSTYATAERKTPSESVAKEMLRDVMLGTDTKGRCVIATTFSSHIARLKSIIEFGKVMNRKIVLLGRSLNKYVTAAENINLVNFTKDVEIVKYGKQIKRKLRDIEQDGKDKYLLIMTGHQGEPGSTLSKIATGKFPFKLDSEDIIIFSCRTIPSPVNIENREILENHLREYKLRMFKDIHVSGHASREDLRDLFTLVEPVHIIPAHGNITMRTAMYNLADELGYNTKENVHLLSDGDHITLE